MMDFVVLTIFPKMFDPFLELGIIGKALEKKKISATTIDIRDFAKDRHKTTDDRPYGGGCGMVFKPEPLAGALDCAREKTPDAKTILLSPQGRVFNQNLACELAVSKSLILVCGRYEGIDERVREHLVTHEISIGDYVLTGGELPALVLIDVLGHGLSVAASSVFATSR